MARRYVCLKGHLWAYEEDDGDVAPALFCPTCGLRLYVEGELRDQPPRGPLRAAEPTPIHSVELLRLGRGSTDGAVAAPPLQPSEIEEIPGYELLGVLGRGGMGIVFRARQLSLKRQVALKMILTGRHARPEEHARFQREAEAVARLQHPNIVQIYEVGQQNGLPYFSLEFVNAGSLAGFLGGNPQPPIPAAQLVRQLAGAMHYAHKRGIVHRDLKPANILLHLDESQIQRDGQGADTTIFRDLSAFVPKISDFGLAKHMEGEEGPFRKGAILGTPSYMAPEQAGGAAGTIGPAADVYALGAILYEMISGRPPFKATSAAETAQQVLTQEPVPPTELQPKVPRDLETICLTCLQKDPACRYVSAEAVAEDLRRFLANEPILARSSAWSDRVGKWSRRHPAGAAALLAAGLLFILLAWNGSRHTLALREELAQAQYARQTAEGQLHHAMDVMDQMVAQADRPDVGAAAMRRDILERACVFYQELIRAGEAEPGTRLLAVLACLRLGDAQRRLGTEDEARRSYQHAILLLRVLAESSPDGEDYHRLLQEGEQRLQSTAPHPVPARRGS